jgi:hypothetical protein
MKNDLLAFSRVLAIRSLYDQYFLHYDYFDTLFNRKYFSIFFSLCPNSDLHRFIQINFRYHFNQTIGIRPELTEFSVEEKFNISDILFYKNDIELSIFENFRLDLKCKLMLGGVLINEKELFKESNNSQFDLLIHDTCTNIFPNSSEIRENGLFTIYEHIEKFSKDRVVYHQFHPGLTFEIKKKTIEMLKRYNVNVTNDYTKLTHIGLVFSYLSSSLFDFVLSKIPIVLLCGEFDLFKNKKRNNEIYYTPFFKVNNIHELNSFFLKIKNGENIKNICMVDELYSWFIKFNNYPKGMETIIKCLNSDCENNHLDSTSVGKTLQQ